MDQRQNTISCHCNNTKSQTHIYHSIDKTLFHVTVITANHKHIFTIQFQGFLAVISLTSYSCLEHLSMKVKVTQMVPVLQKSVDKRQNVSQSCCCKVTKKSERPPCLKLACWPSGKSVHLESARPGSIPALSRSSHTSDLNIDTPVAALPGAV